MENSTNTIWIIVIDQGCYVGSRTPRQIWRRQSLYFTMGKL